MRCANCGTELIGEFCHSCGQHRVAADEFAILPLVRQFGGELAHLDFKSVVAGVLSGCLRLSRKGQAPSVASSA